ncbi:MAG TPA: response regulator [Longimicrobiales bacterium]|nr:response regulator [Longimicrobiales bacterium]
MERKTVLVVEDNRDELMIYTTLLSHRGYAILTAGDYHTALDIAREHHPDLAVVDVNLGSPTHDGTDLVRALRATESTRAMPVIAHTAFGDVYRDSLDSVGCDRILHKPTNPSVLLETIEELIGPPGS